MTTPQNSRWITEEPLQLQGLLDETETPAAGAVVAFGGTVRLTNDGREVSGMSYDAHRSMAAATLRQLEAEALARFAITGCRAVHRVGELALGDVSVWVVVRAAHRGPAFEAASWLIDTLKERAEIWKEEHYVEGDSKHLDGTPIQTKKDE